MSAPAKIEAKIALQTPDAKLPITKVNVLSSLERTGYYPKDKIRGHANTTFNETITMDPPVGKRELAFAVKIKLVNEQVVFTGRNGTTDIVVRSIPIKAIPIGVDFYMVHDEAAAGVKKGLYRASLVPTLNVSEQHELAPWWFDLSKDTETFPRDHLYPGETGRVKGYIPFPDPKQ